MLIPIPKRKLKRVLHKYSDVMLRIYPSYVLATEKSSVSEVYLTRPMAIKLFELRRGGQGI
jgi:hypothetical protein